jgi:hypothetical protein
MDIEELYYLVKSIDNGYYDVPFLFGKVLDTLRFEGWSGEDLESIEDLVWSVCEKVVG